MTGARAKYFFDAMPLPGEDPNSKVVVRDNTIESFWGGGVAHGSAQANAPLRTARNVLPGREALS